MLKAGQWPIDVWQERDLYGSVALSKGLLEFFLIVFRRVCDELRLPVLVGTHAVGERVGAVGNAAEVLEAVQSYPTWVRMSQNLADVEELLLPVPVTSGKSLRDCVLVSVRSEREGELLGAAAELRVCVHDRLVPAGGASGRATTLAQNVDGLVRGVRRHSGSENVNLEQAEFPACESSRTARPACSAWLCADCAFMRSCAA